MVSFGTFGSPRWVVAADLDADGRVDAATADLFADRVSVLLNTTVANAVPIANNDSYTPASQPAPNVLANDVDPDGDDLTAAPVTNPTKGTLALDPDGSFVYTPNAGATGTDSFTYTASDGFAVSNPATVTITLTPPNQAPVAGNDRYTVLVGLLGLSVGAPGVLADDSDPDGDPLTASLVSGPRNGSLQLNANGSFSYRPRLLFIGVDSFTYRARDDNGAFSAPATVTLTVVLPGLGLRVV
jgi:VCBS repeat-containing protein